MLKFALSFVRDVLYRTPQATNSPKHFIDMAGP